MFVLDISEFPRFFKFCFGIHFKKKTSPRVATPIAGLTPLRLLFDVLHQLDVLHRKINF